LGKSNIGGCLDGFADLAVSQGQPERAVQLWVAAEALREALGAHLPPLEREKYIHSQDAVRKSLSDEAFAAAWEAGRAMTWEQAVDSVLEELDS
jgi:hypothetical protein